MYGFVDTTEIAGDNILPAEAVCINGEYIENRIEGYKTLYTSGRESLAKEFERYNDTVADGSLTKYARFPARTITVGFQLLTSSPEAFREAFNVLNALLNVEDAEVIFNDEQDKFFIGSPIMDAEIEPGSCTVKGEYQIYCADPFKYSVDWQSPQPVYAEDSDTGLYQTFLIDYAGTYPAYPRYIAKFYNPDGETDEDNAEFDQTDITKELGNIGSCKFVAFMDNDNHVLQFGNPDIADESDVPPPLVLTSRSFKKSGSYDASKNGEEWVSPAAGYSKLSKHKQQGSLGTGAAIYGATQQVIEKNQTLLASTAGTSCKYQAIITRVNGRTSSKVTLNIQVKMTNLTADITKGASLTVEVTYGSKTVTKILKTTSVAWKKKTAHSCSFSMTVDASSTKTELSGIKIKVTRKNGTYKVKQSGKTVTKTATGSVGKLTSKTCKPIEIPYYTAIPIESYYVRPSSYGSVVASTYTGPTMTWKYPTEGLPETDDGTGANNFTLTWSMKFCMGKTTNETLQMGAFECLVLTGSSMDASGNIANQKVLAGFLITKPNTSTKGNIYLYSENKNVYKQLRGADLTWNKGLLGNKSGAVSCSIVKSGSKVTFTLGKLFGGKSKSYKLTSMKNSRAFKIVFGFYRYGASPAFDWNGIRSVTLKKIYDTEAELEEEPFSATQVLVADSSTNEITLDGLPRPDLGALGNDWERMCLTPGINEITTAFSQRQDAAVKVIRRCREDEPFQGVQAYDEDDDGTAVQVDKSDRGAKTYYQYHTGVGEASDVSGNAYRYTGTYTDEDGKQHITSSTLDFIEVSLTDVVYSANPTKYFVAEDPVPEFSINYREAFL